MFYTISAPVALIRYAALEIGNRLRDRSQLVAASDVFFLTREGAAEALDDGRPRVDVVAQGQAELNRVRAHPGPSNYGKDPGPPPSLDALPPGARLVNQALLWYVERIFQTQNSGQDACQPTAPGQSQFFRAIEPELTYRCHQNLSPSEIPTPPSLRCRYVITGPPLDF